MILYGFCLLPAWFCYVNVRNLESHMHIADRCAPRENGNGAEDLSRSRSHVSTVSQSVCQGIEPTLGLVTRYYFLSEGCFLKVAVLCLRGALSDDGSRLSFVILSLDKVQETSNSESFRFNIIPTNPFFAAILRLLSFSAGHSAARPHQFPWSLWRGHTLQSRHGKQLPWWRSVVATCTLINCQWCCDNTCAVMESRATVSWFVCSVSGTRVHSSPVKVALEPQNWMRPG
jgi:hypothetical protein